MRAPLFYDSNNTSYYVNPASTSVLNDLYTYDDIFVGSSAADDDADLYIADKLYDWDDTGYYLNPADTSVLNVINANSFAYSSDKALKKDIEIIPDALSKVNKLEGISFKWKKDDERTNLGLIAQDIEKVFPEVIHTDRETGLKSVEYGNLVSPVIEAIKELTKKVDKLFGMYFDQQKQINDLQKQIQNLENVMIQ
jgi:hypothetical protein